MIWLPYSCVGVRRHWLVFRSVRMWPKVDCFRDLWRGFPDPPPWHGSEVRVKEKMLCHPSRQWIVLQPFCQEKEQEKKPTKNLIMFKDESKSTNWKLGKTGSTLTIWHLTVARGPWTIVGKNVATEEAATRLSVQPKTPASFWLSISQFGWPSPYTCVSR